MPNDGCGYGKCDDDYKVDDGDDFALFFGIFQKYTRGRYILGVICEITKTKIKISFLERERVKRDKKRKEEIEG